MMPAMDILGRPGPGLAVPVVGLSNGKRTHCGLFFQDVSLLELWRQTKRLSDPATVTAIARLTVPSRALCPASKVLIFPPGSCELIAVVERSVDIHPVCARPLSSSM